KWPMVIAGAVLVLALAFFSWVHVIAAGGIALGAFVIASAFVVLLRRWQFVSFPAPGIAAALRTTPRGVWGMVLAHAGLGVAAIGITAVSAFQTNLVLDMKPGQHAELAGRQVTMASVERVAGPNYLA